MQTSRTFKIFAVRRRIYPFKPWLSQLASACIVEKRDVREVAICSSTGPVLEVLNSIDDAEDWATHRDEL